MEIALDHARGKHVLVALSGGADSVALLLLVCRARDAGMLRVSAAHFEHGIRGAESRGDAEFCQKLCDRLNVPLAMGKADVPETARRMKQGLEACARKLRYEFLYETARKLGTELIALGHHMDDQAETVLMHLLRGCGPEGIAGMQILSGSLYRPLLGVRKTELTAFLESIGESWREDTTNRSADNPRNILRISAMPKLEQAYPGAARALCRYADSARFESDYVARMAERFAAERVEMLPHGWRVNLSGACEEALLRRTLRTLCGPDLSWEKLYELTRLATATDIVNGMRAERHGAYLYVIKPFEPPTARLINIEGMTELSGICCITASPSPPEPERTLKSTQTLDRRALIGAVLRTRREGDRIAPFGMRGSKSLSDYFTDIKLDPPLRDIVPVVAKGKDILWVVGHGIARESALTGEAAVRLHCDYIGWGGFHP